MAGKSIPLRICQMKHLKITVKVARFTVRIHIFLTSGVVFGRCIFRILILFHKSTICNVFDTYFIFSLKSVLYNNRKDTYNDANIHKCRRKAMIVMKFTKMHGCGNDYVYVNCFEENVKEPGETARRISDRRFGIGSDGLILICPSEKADVRMRMYNADGSEGEMCGNGIRCVAKYVYDRGLSDKTELSVETGAGIKRLKLFTEEGKVTQVRVDMGEPILDPEQIPVLSSKERVIDEPIMVNGKEWRMTCVSMGNPHAVVFVPDTESLEIEKYGPYFECHERFPKRINTEFVQVTDRDEINMRVWERGSAETWACGTGTCASVMACILNDKTDDTVLVHLRGGDLKIEYDRDTNHLFMTGPAETVFEGEWPD